MPVSKVLIVTSKGIDEIRAGVLVVGQLVSKVLIVTSNGIDEIRAGVLVGGQLVSKVDIVTSKGIDEIRAGVLLVSLSVSKVDIVTSKETDEIRAGVLLVSLSVSKVHIVTSKESRWIGCHRRDLSCTSAQTKSKTSKSFSVCVTPVCIKQDQISFGMNGWKFIWRIKKQIKEKSERRMKSHCDWPALRSDPCCRCSTSQLRLH